MMQQTRSHSNTKVFLVGPLALGLALGSSSSSAFALRQTGLEESNPDTKQSLITQLTTPTPIGNWNNAPRKIDQLPAGLVTAGLEKKAPVRILIADTPQRETVPGDIRKLIQSMKLDGKVELIEERGQVTYPSPDRR